MHNLEAVFPLHHHKVRAAVNNHVKSSAYSYKRRTLRGFLRFISFASTEYGQLNEENLNLALASFRNHCYTSRGGSSVITADSDYRAFANLMKKLSGKELPHILIPKSLPANIELLRVWDKQSCLGYMNPRFWKEEYETLDHPIQTAIPSEHYLDLFIKHQRSYMDSMKVLARDYIEQAHARYQKGKEYIANTSSMRFSNSPLYEEKISVQNGQRYSLFSDQLPDDRGIRNLVGYLHHQHQGLITRTFPGANNHLYRFGGRTFLSEHLGLSADLAAACAVIIVSETGINPESLYDITLTGDKNKVSSIISRCDQGKGFELVYTKKRAGGTKKKLVISDKSHTINAEYCFELLVEVTQEHRKHSGLRQLFIHDSQHKVRTITPVSKTAFKGALKRLVSRSNDTDLIMSFPTLAKLRVSGGILAWYDNGGDPRAASRYLGNTPSVALRHYLPREVQEIVYSQQIRAFQNILIAVTTKEKEYQQAALSIRDKTHFIKFLNTTVQNSSIHRLLETAKRSVPTASSSSKITFVLSETNIAMLYNAKSLFERSMQQSSKEELEEWHNFAVLIFKFIQQSNNRRYQAVMRRGIEKAKHTPLDLKDIF